MSKDLTEEELKTASKAMKSAGHIDCDEFCKHLYKTIFTAYCNDEDNDLITISAPDSHKEE